MPTGVYKKTDAHRKKIGDSKRGEKNHSWKGDEVGYKGLHHWVKSVMGTPNTCEHCGKSGLSGHKIHWANRNHTYKRILTDWIRLCAKCHK